LRGLPHSFREADTPPLAFRDAAQSSDPTARRGKPRARPQWRRSRDLAAGIGGFWRSALAFRRTRGARAALADPTWVSAPRCIDPPYELLNLLKVFEKLCSPLVDAHPLFGRGVLRPSPEFPGLRSTRARPRSADDRILARSSAAVIRWSLNSITNGASPSKALKVEVTFGTGAGAMRIGLRRSRTTGSRTRDQALWSSIRNRTSAIVFGG
jgi:hypothetical protein